MIPATKFQRGKRLGIADLDDAREMCPVCRSARQRRPIYRIQRDPDVAMLECATCGAASASHMPKPGVLATYFHQLRLRRPADDEAPTSEHVPQGFTAHIMDRLLDTEAQRIEAGGTIPFGTSCLAVWIKD